MKWRSRLIERGLPGLAGEGRPGRPRRSCWTGVGEVLAATLEEMPEDAAHWPRASMARRSGLPESAVGRIWRKSELKPHLVDGFKPSTGPLFTEKAVDVAGLYRSPPERAVVLCVDEKTRVQALGRSRPALPMMPGMPERRTHGYARHGAARLFAGFSIAGGAVISGLHRGHRAAEQLKFLRAIGQAVPAGLGVHIVCDSLSARKTPAVNEWIARRPRFRVRFAPTGSSRLNQAERWFASLTAQLLQRSACKPVRALEAGLRDWIGTWNDGPRPFAWKKTAEEILDSLARYLQRIKGGEH